MIEGYDYEIQGAVARSVEGIRHKLAELDDKLPANDAEHASIGELREACRIFLNRHARGLDWNDFNSTLGEREWDAVLKLRTTFAEVLLDWYDNKGLEAAQGILNRIEIDSGRPAFLPPG